MRLDVGSAAVCEVMAFRDPILEAYSYRTRSALFRQRFHSLSGDARWLFDFACWFSLLNPRWLALEAGRFRFVPVAKHNHARFSEFIALVRLFEDQRIVTFSEEPWVRFLARCDATHRRFYLLLASRGFTIGLPHSEIERIADMDRIFINEVYDRTGVGTTGGGGAVAYPVLIRSVPRRGLQRISLCKFGSKARMLVGSRTTDLPHSLRRDLGFIALPHFTLYGLYDPELERFYPCDLKEKGLEQQAVELRIERLNQVLGASLLQNIDTSRVALVAGQGDWPYALAEALDGGTPAYVLAAHVDFSADGLFVELPVTQTTATIQDLWVDEGQPLGLEVLYEGASCRCGMTFQHKKNSLLNNKKALIGATLKAYHIQTMASDYLSGYEVAFD